MRKLSQLWVLLLLVVLVGGASTGHADSWITQTGCDTLSLDPLRVGVEFLVTAPIGEYVRYFQVAPLPQGSPGECAVQDCAAPTGWVGHVFPSDHVARFDCAQCYLPSGSTAGPFRIVMGAVPCSYVVRYYIGGLPEWIFEETVTFTPSIPVPTQARSWGQLKAHYR
jgi:hypothetical protein